MMKTFLRLAGVCALGVGTIAQAVEVKQDHPASYVVQRGDTLWDISGKFLNNPWEWPALWENNQQIENPDRIYPGDVLSLTYVDGEPRLSVNRGDAGRTLKFSPGDTVKLTPQVRSTPLESPIPAIPLDAIQSFMGGHRVLEEKDVEGAPYILAGDQEHITMGAGDLVYARGDWSAPAKSYGIYRDGKHYTDPESGEFLGFGVADVGTVRFESSQEDVGRFRVTASNRDVRVGDRLIPFDERKVDSVFYPKPPKGKVDGQIIHVFAGVANASQFDVVVLSRGERDGLAVGDVLSVMGRGETVRDRVTDEMVKLPDERRGMLIVFRSFEKVSYGLILRATAPVRLGDRIVNPD